MMARRRISGRQLAQQLGVSPAWVSYRLSGSQEIGLNDLQRIATALSVQVGDLLPASARERSIAQTIRPTKTARYGAARTLLTSPRRTPATPTEAKMTILSASRDPGQPALDGRASRLPA